MNQWQIRIISRHHEERMQVCFVGSFLLGFTLRGKPIVRQLSVTRHLHRKGDFWTGTPLPGQQTTIWLTEADLKVKVASQPERKAA